MPVQFICLTCGSTFEDRPSRASRYCSRSCWNARPKKADTPQYTCETCGDRFHRPKSSFRRTSHIYCSIQCAGSPKRLLDPNGRPLARPGVYAILHTPSGSAYVGSTKNISRRWGDHRSALKSGRHTIKPLQHAWTTDGKSAFEFVVLEDVINLDNLLAREQAWMDQYQATGVTLFNVSPLASSTAGMKQRAEVIARAKADPSRRFRGKLSKVDVLAIKAKLINTVDYLALASEYGVHRHTIYMIATGRMFADVDS